MLIERYTRSDNQQWLEQRVDEAVRRMLARLPRV